jgi:hypothetical protein
MPRSELHSLLNSLTLAPHGAIWTNKAARSNAGEDRDIFFELWKREGYAEASAQNRNRV